MTVINQANKFPAEFAIFVVELEQQASLVEQLIQNIKSWQKKGGGFISGTVFCSCDGLQVTSYIQWKDRDSYVATQPLENFATPDVHLYEIFAAEPESSELKLSSTMEGLINFGTFKMKNSSKQPRFIELFRQALTMVSGQAGLISTHAHHSLDGWRCINFGYWRSLEDFTAMDNNRPFSPLFGEMLDLAENEYKKTLHKVVFST